jgi:hypothetical protein
MALHVRATIVLRLMAPGGGSLQARIAERPAILPDVFLFSIAITPVPVARERRRTTQLAFRDVGSIAPEASVIGQLAPWNRVIYRTSGTSLTSNPVLDFKKNRRESFKPSCASAALATLRWSVERGAHRPASQEKAIDQVAERRVVDKTTDARASATRAVPSLFGVFDLRRSLVSWSVSSGW